MIVRCGADVIQLDAMGVPTWQVALGPRSGEGTFLAAAAETVVTDVRSDPKRMTTVVGMRAGEVRYRTALDCLVADQASCIVGTELFVLGITPKGTVLRSVRVTDGTRRLDQVRRGRDVASAGERLLVLDAMNEPGIQTISLDGGDERVLEQTPTQQLALSTGRVLGAVRTSEAPHRTARMRDLTSGNVLWSHPSYGASVGLDASMAIHVELVDGAPVPVARDAVSGELVWRGSAALGDDTGTFRFAGQLVAFTHGTGTTLYQRATGTFLAEVVASYALAAIGDRLYFGESEHLRCADAR